MKQTKTILSMLCAAALFAACSSTDELEPVVQTGQQTAEEAVGFDVYTRGTQTTRAGYVGEMDATAFQVTGFGVYGYVTSAASAAGAKWETVNGTATSTPDFMANQHVTYASSAWTYSPVKYWPNQANITSNGVDNLGGGSATNNGTNIDYVSFFAYAPYVDNASLPPFTGATEDAIISAAKTDAALKDPTYSGITWLPSNTTKGDPTVIYRMAPDPTNSVDLMYGVAARAYSINETTGKIGQPVTAGKPFLDMTKEVVDDKLNYRFQHALTKLAVNVDAYFDEARTGSAESAKDVDPNTRIVIKSIILKSDKLAVYGVLNLNNSEANKPDWGTAPDNAIIADDAENYDSGKGYALPIAPGLLHISTGTGTAAYFAQQPLGVTKTKQSLLGYAVDGTTPASLMFVPNTAGTSDLTIEIEYRVITRDTRLQKQYSEIPNVIKNTIDAAKLNFAPGYSTVLNLHLGMTTVKMDAVVTDWDGTNTQDVDLPANVAVASLTAPTTINEFGEITFGSVSANLTGGGSQTLSINDVYFTDEQNNVLTVTPNDPSTPTKWWIPGNYKGSARTIKMWYGGVSTDISQEPLDATSDIVIAFATTPSPMTNAGGSIDITIYPSTDVKDYNISDWSLTQSIDGGSEMLIEGAPTGAGTSVDPHKYTVTIPTNSSTTANKTYSFKLTHKNGLNKSESVIVPKVE